MLKPSWFNQHLVSHTCQVDKLAFKMLDLSQAACVQRVKRYTFSSLVSWKKNVAFIYFLSVRSLRLIDSVSRCTCLHAASPSASAGRIIISSRRAAWSSSVSPLLYVCEGCSAPVGIFHRCSPPNVTISHRCLKHRLKQWEPLE